MADYVVECAHRLTPVLSETLIKRINASYFTDNTDMWPRTYGGGTMKQTVYDPSFCLLISAGTSNQSSI